MIRATRHGGRSPDSPPPPGPSSLPPSTERPVNALGTTSAPVFGSSSLRGAPVHRPTVTSRHLRSPGPRPSTPRHHCRTLGHCAGPDAASPRYAATKNVPRSGISPASAPMRDDAHGESHSRSGPSHADVQARLTEDPVPAAAHRRLLGRERADCHCTLTATITSSPEYCSRRRERSSLASISRTGSTTRGPNCTARAAAGPSAVMTVATLSPDVRRPVVPTRDDSPASGHEAWGKPASFDGPVLGRTGEYLLGVNANGTVNLSHGGGRDVPARRPGRSRGREGLRPDRDHGQAVTGPGRRKPPAQGPGA